MIVQAVLSLDPIRVLDLGMGTGKYGFLLREQTDFAAGRVERTSWRLQIDGVEGFAPYIGDHQRAAYNEIFVTDALQFLASFSGDAYDAALAIDVIEHFEPEDAVRLVERALTAASVVYMSTPKGFDPQTDPQNELERHRSWWPRVSLKRLAATCNAECALMSTRMTNIAVLSRGARLPRLTSNWLRNTAAMAKDRLLPEIAYYRAIGRAGPRIP